MDSFTSGERGEVVSLSGGGALRDLGDFLLSASSSPMMGRGVAVKILSCLVDLGGRRLRPLTLFNSLRREAVLTMGGIAPGGSEAQPLGFIPLMTR